MPRETKIRVGLTQNWSIGRTTGALPHKDAMLDRKPYG
ncbi:hypothetical protein SAMN05428967_1310 [Phyllobacterium sp. YR620]|nr:hypothetical protein SAMN05428967_1310 [Phyllobacterium sp. YR620]